MASETSSLIRGSHLKKIARHGSIYLISSILVKGGHFLLLPIYTHYLNPSEFAVYTNLIAVGLIAGLFISLYMDTAYGRLYFDVEQNFDRLRRLFSTIFYFLLVWGTFATALTFFIIRRGTSGFLGVPSYPHVLLACLIPLVTQMNALAGHHFRSQHRSQMVMIGHCANFGVAASVSVYLLVGAGLGAQALLFGTLAGACVNWLWYYGALWREGLIGARFSFHSAREAFVFSVALLPMSALDWLSGAADKLLITWFGSLADSGVYSLAFETGRGMNFFIVSVFMAYGPMIFAMLKEGREKNIARIEQFRSFYVHVLVGLAFFITLFSPELFALFIEEKYHPGLSFVPVITFAFMFGGIRKLYATLIYYHKLTGLISLGTILAGLFRFGFNILFIPRIGAAAAAWARLGGSLFAATFFYAASRRHEPLKFDRGAFRVTALTLGGCVALWLLGDRIFKLEFWSLFAWKLMILGFAAAFTWRSRFGLAIRKTLNARGRQDTGIQHEPFDESLGGNGADDYR